MLRDCKWLDRKALFFQQCDCIAALTESQLQGMSSASADEEVELGGHRPLSIPQDTLFGEG